MAKLKPQKAAKQQQAQEVSIQARDAVLTCCSIVVTFGKGRTGQDCKCWRVTPC